MSTVCKMTRSRSSNPTSWLWVCCRWSARGRRFSSPIRKEEDQSGARDRLLIVQEGSTVPVPLRWCQFTHSPSENTSPVDWGVGRAWGVQVGRFPHFFFLFCLFNDWAVLKKANCTRESGVGGWSSVHQLWDSYGSICSFCLFIIHR